MSFTMQLQVNGTKLIASSVPFLAEKTEDAVVCRFLFDESWDGFSRTAIFHRNGPGQPLIALPLNRDGCAELPPPLTACAKPFCLSVEGENGSCRLRTNTVCLSFRRGERGGLPLTFYNGSYTLTENGTYPTSGELMKSDIRVEVPYPDLSGDTVTAPTLLRGITAHDRNDRKIVGTLDPYDGKKFHLTCSLTEPTDHGKLWLRTDIQPQQEGSGYIRPFQTMYGMETWDGAAVYCEGSENSMFSFGQRRNTPYLLRLFPDGTFRSWKLAEAAAGNAYEWSALDMCAVNGRVYVLLGAGSASSANRRAIRVYVFDLSSQTGQIRTTVDNGLYTALCGGIASADNGNVYLFVHGDGRTRFYRYDTGTESTVQIGTDLTNCNRGGGGFAKASDGKLYTMLHMYPDADQLFFDPQTEKADTCPIEANTALANAFLLGGDGETLFIRDGESLWYLRLGIGSTDRFPLCMFDEDGLEPLSCRAWRIAGEQVFLLSQDVDGCLYCGVLERVCKQPGVYLVQKRSGTLCTVVKTSLTEISAELSMALATDENGVWKPCPLYRYASGVWREIRK